MSRSSYAVGRDDGRRFLEEWLDAGDRLGATRHEVGRSVQGEPLWALELGPPAGKPVLLTALIHGNEFIGSVALLRWVRHWFRACPKEAAQFRLVVMPVLNPDAFLDNCERLGEGRRVMRRCNARGVDLNRNFPWVSRALPWHPFAGSRRKWSPYFMGPAPFSEPESCAVRDVVSWLRPKLSLGFHSFGNVLLFPWAHSSSPNPREPTYRAMGRAFQSAQLERRYRVLQARGWYPTVGDLDDWLDAQHGALAYTVEVGRLDFRTLHPKRLLNTFWWMNSSRVEETASELTRGLEGLMRTAATAL